MFAIRASASHRGPGLVLAVTSGINAVKGNVVGAELRVIEDYGFMTAVFWVDGVEDDAGVKSKVKGALALSGKELLDFHSRVLVLSESPHKRRGGDIDLADVIDLAGLDAEFAEIMADKGNVADLVCGSAEVDEQELLHDVAEWLENARIKIVDLSAAVLMDKEVPRCEMHLSVEVPLDGRSLEVLRSEFEKSFDAFVDGHDRLWWNAEKIHWGLHVGRT